MSKPKRQRTLPVTLKDRETGWALVTRIRVERRCVTVMWSPGILLRGPEWTDPEAMAEILGGRAMRLGQLLQARWFGTVTP